MAELTPIIKESFIQYSGAVLQSRALVDVRDCLKPSARQIFYSMLLNKMTPENKTRKTAAAVGSALVDFYIHGEASCLGILMHAAQNFSMRYPLVTVRGNCGTPISSGNWAASRYTESKLSYFSKMLFQDINKNVISDWRDNYENTKQYPSVLPSKGFYNIVNGTLGIGIGMGSSIPQFNLKDVNEALITLINNPDCDFEEIYCVPDFATGGILLNESEVKESLRNGFGKSCKLRAVVEYNVKDHCLIVKEMPYGVYTNTVCKELEAILNSDNTMGIDRFNDLTGKEPNLKIYLTKKANPAQVLRNLYKSTSLQSHYGINMTMLENGKFPKVFSWKEALQNHIDHEKDVYRRGFEFDLKKLSDRLHIVEGIIIALANIEEVIQTIKKSASSSEASLNLQKKFILDEIQAKAVLDIKLVRLAHLEIEKFKQEKISLLSQIEQINEILTDENLFNAQLIAGWKEVIRKYGDSRRTKVMDIEKDDEDEPIEKKQMVVYLTNYNNIYAYEDSSLIAQKRGGAGSRIKLSDGEIITETLTDSNYSNLLLFSTLGKVYTLKLDCLILDKKLPITTFVELEDDEIITTMITDSEKDNEEFVCFVTKNGMIKKTLLKEYHIKKGKGVVAIKLKDNDSIKNVFMASRRDNVAIATSMGYYVSFPISDFAATGRATQGVKAITLRDNDFVSNAVIIKPEAQEVVSITTSGKIKKTPIEEIPLGSRAQKGVLIHKVEDFESLACIQIADKETKGVIVSSTERTIRFVLEEVRTSARSTIGTKSIDLKPGQKVTTMTTYN